MSDSAHVPTPMAADAPRVRLADVVWLALAAATLAALAAVATDSFQRLVLHTLTRTSRDFAWMSWVGNVVIFLLPLPLVVVVALVLRRWGGFTVAAGAYAALSFLAILLLLPRLHPMAQLLLALGAGVRVGTAVGGDPRRWMPRVRAFARGGMALVVLLAVVSFGRRARDERRALSALPSAAGDGPNVILLILDTVRAASMSVYGYDRPTTPVLERLARNGTLFEQAFSTAAWTAPSHASMMTGLHAGETRADYLASMVDSVPTVAEQLAARGYVSGGFIANARFAGIHMGIGRGFSRYEDYPVSWSQVLSSASFARTITGLGVLEGLERGELWRVRRALMRYDLRTIPVPRGRVYSAAEISRNFLRWRDDVEPGRPYFAMLNFFDAHEPFEPPDGFARRFNDGQREQDRYDGGIAYMDSVVGNLVDQLRVRGDLDRTVLIITSDHGELWGEHGMTGHGNSLFIPVLHVPLLVIAPGSTPPGSRVSSVVSLRDLAATMVDLGGVPAGTLPGTSLVPIWQRTARVSDAPIMIETTAAVNPTESNLAKFGPIRGTLDSTWHYIRYGNGREELFAWRSDPEEVDDRFPTPSGAAVAARYREMLERKGAVGGATFSAKP